MKRGDCRVLSDLSAVAFGLYNSWLHRYKGSNETRGDMAAVNSLTCLLPLMGWTTADYTGTSDLMKRGETWLPWTLWPVCCCSCGAWFSDWSYLRYLGNHCLNIPMWLVIRKQVRISPMPQLTQKCTVLCACMGQVSFLCKCSWTNVDLYR
jgi:hypothetical protein